MQTVLIDASRDGVAQISQALAGQHDIDAIHIISHGADGILELGSTMLDFKGLLANVSAFTWEPDGGVTVQIGPRLAASASRARMHR